MVALHETPAVNHEPVLVVKSPHRHHTPAITFLSIATSAGIESTPTVVLVGPIAPKYPA
jgi:hypothetical protein